MAAAATTRLLAPSQPHVNRLEFEAMKEKVMILSKGQTRLTEEVRGFVGCRQSRNSNETTGRDSFNVRTTQGRSTIGGGKTQRRNEGNNKERKDYSRKDGEGFLFK